MVGDLAAGNGGDAGDAGGGGKGGNGSSGDGSCKGGKGRPWKALPRKVKKEHPKTTQRSGKGRPWEALPRRRWWQRGRQGPGPDADAAAGGGDAGGSGSSESGSGKGGSGNRRPRGALPRRHWWQRGRRGPGPDTGAGAPAGGGGKGASGGKGSSEGEGKGSSEGAGEGKGKGKGSSEGAGEGKGKGKGSSEGAGEGKGKGKGSSEGAGEGKGKGSSEGAGEGKGKGKDKGSSEGAGEGKGEDPWHARDVDYVGFRHGDPDQATNPAERDAAYGISSGERTHMAIFGLPGCGKSSLIKLLAYQNIMRGQGFMVVDPHGELARDIMSMVPADRHKDVIYVNPASLYRYGRTVQINPLEVREENERYVVVMSFVSTLYNLYREAWGPRLEIVLRNAANALVESRAHSTLRNISALITDEDERASILEGVASKNVRHFWEEIFAKQYSKDAGSAAYNKIDKILATPTVAAMFDASESSISISDIIEEKRMLVVDLSTGASDDIAQFLGSIFLNMLYVEAKKRIDVRGDGSGAAAGEAAEAARDNPFYVYVDEAHMFSNSTMSEMLRALRKFGVKVTIATQTCNAYESDFADEIPGTCKTVITGRCDYNTAKLVRAIMAVSVDEMQRMPSHTFALYTDEAGTRANAVFRSRPVPFPGKALCDWREVARESAGRWGREVNVEKYMPSKGVGPLLFNPLETSIVHMLHFDRRDWLRDEIFARLPAIFGSVKQARVAAALDKLVQGKYVDIRRPSADDGDQHETKKRYVIGSKAYRTYLSRAAGGRRAGSEEHLDIIFKIQDANMRRHRYCVPDLGDRGGDAPDLLVVEPAVTKGEGGYPVYDPFAWNTRRRLAVEVETDPTKHMDQAVRNYAKNAELGCDVWFVCFEERHREALEDAIRAAHPDFRGCRTDSIDAARVLQGKADIPDTYEETFTSGIKVRGMDEILQVTGEERATREPPKTPYSLHNLEAANREGKKGGAAAKAAATGGGAAGAADAAAAAATAAAPATAGAADPPGPGPGRDPAAPAGVQGGVRRLPHMNELETAIYDLVVQGGGSIACDPKLISRKTGETHAIADVRAAMNRLVMEGALKREKWDVARKVGSVDGTGDKIKRGKRTVLAIPQQEPWPPEGDADGDGDGDGAAGTGLKRSYWKRSGDGKDTDGGQDADGGQEAGEGQDADGGQEAGEGKDADGGGQEAGEGKDADGGQEAGEGQDADGGQEAGEGKDADGGQEAGEGQDADGGQEAGEGQDADDDGAAEWSGEGEGEDGWEPEEGEKKKATMRATVHEEFRADDYQDRVLQAMVADESYAEHHAAIKAELERRMNG